MCIRDSAGTAHAAACDGDIRAARCFAGIGRKCSPVGRKRGLCEQRGHLAAALRITRQKHNGRGAAQAGTAAVSYTHLDVYKRQHSHNAAIS